MVPDIPVRDGYKSFNVNLLEALIQGYSDLKISINDLLEFSVLLANNVFGQSWKIGPNNEDESENKNEGEDVTENPDKPKVTKKRKKLEDLSHTMPCRKAILNWTETGAILNFKYLAEEITKASDVDSVVVLGIDDTVKAAGHKKHDVKCGTVTIVDKDKKRTNYSVGYSANISHSGEDAAESVRHTLTMMAVLTSTS